MPEKVHKLVNQIKWPRTRGRHAVKAAMFMRQWARETREVEPGTMAAIQATASIIKGVQPRELRHLVEAARDRALPEGGAVKIPPHVNSVHFAGMLILHSAKQLDAQEERSRKLERRAKMAQINVNLLSKSWQVQPIGFVRILCSAAFQRQITQGLHPLSIYKSLRIRILCWKNTWSPRSILLRFRT